MSVFRELLQNADDAQSSTVEIHFKTTSPRLAENDSPEIPDLKSSDVRVCFLGCILVQLN